MVDHIYLLAPNISTPNINTVGNNTFLTQFLSILLNSPKRNIFKLSH